MTYGITNAGGGKSANLGTKTITANGTYSAATDGLDGYSEVTANVQTVPTLQSKIARQNGVITADQGYDGLSSVDVGVGQVGQSYSALNLTGNSLAQNDKVWLTYRGPKTESRVITYGGYYGLYPALCSINGDYAIYNVSYSRSGWDLYAINNNTSSLIENFSWWSRDDNKIAYYTQDSLKLIVAQSIYTVSENTATLQLDASGVLLNTGVRRELGYGFYINSGILDKQVLYDANGDTYTYPDIYFGRPYCVFKKDNNLYLLTTHWGQTYSDQVVYVMAIDSTNKTLSYYKSATGGTRLDYFNGVTEDGKYAFFYDAILDIDNQAFVTSIGSTSFSNWFFRNPYNPSSKVITGSYVNSSGAYRATHKIWEYDSSTATFNDITANYTLYDLNYGATCVNVTGIAKDRAIYSVGNYTNSWPACVSINQLADSYVITNYNGVSSDSLTGYAAANIAAGAVGDVIIGQRVDGTAITATNQTGSAIAEGDRVYIISNNNLTLVSQNVFNPLIGWTGVAAASIENGSSGLVRAVMTEPAGSLSLYDRVGGIATVFMIYTDDLGTKYAVCLLDAEYRTGPLAFGNADFDVTVMATFGTPSDAINNSRNSLVSASSQMNAVVNAGTLASSPALNYCYGLTTTVGGVTYRGLVPTVKELDAVYADRTALDALDPTVANYPTKSLSDWNLGNDSSRTNGIYSCCPTSSGGYLVMVNDDSNGYCSTDSYMTVKHGVMPIFEIPITE